MRVSMVVFIKKKRYITTRLVQTRKTEVSYTDEKQSHLLYYKYNLKTHQDKHKISNLFCSNGVFMVLNFIGEIGLLSFLLFLWIHNRPPMKEKDLLSSPKVQLGFKIQMGFLLFLVIKCFLNLFIGLVFLHRPYTSNVYVNKQNLLHVIDHQNFRQATKDVLG